MPLMRALVLTNQDDENTYELADQYMFGDALMICPVTTKGELSRTVYLPRGEWYDYWSGKKYSGKQYITAVCPIDTIPIYVKAGAIMPMQEKMNYVGEKPAVKITLDIFPGADNYFELYEDDGKSLSYQDGNYSITRINLTQQGSLKFSIQKPEGKFQPVSHQFILKIHSLSRPNSVTENGQALSFENTHEEGQSGYWIFNEKEKMIYISLKKDASYSIEVK
jgi:alpha-glucosidase (family GH31 glycosyl hydrolase)